MFYLEEEQPWEIVDQNTKRQVLATGKSMMFVKVSFRHKIEGAIAVHAHPHEQITYVLKGSFRFMIGSIEKTVRTGDSISFLSNQFHGCQPLEDDSLLLDGFSPLREDFFNQES